MGLGKNFTGWVRSVGRGVIIGAAVAGMAVVIGSGGTAHAEVPPPASLYPIGAFLQPTYDFAQWKARGVNTMVDFNPGANSQQLWESTAIADGFYEIRAPSANPANDVNNPHLLAWSQPDEPDYNNIPVSTLQSTYNSLKKVDPNMPVYINFSGNDVLYPSSGFSTSYYQTAAKAGDWISSDIYPLNGYGRPDFIDMAETGPWNPGPTKWNGGTTMEALRAITGKPQYAYVETSVQNLGGVPNARGPTPDEVRGEIWDDIINGARGIVYFGFSFSPWSQDATTPAVSNELSNQDALIASLGAVINSGSTTNSQRITLTNPTLEGTWRISNGVEYFIVLNFSHTAVTNQQITLPAALGAGSLRVYEEKRDAILNGDVLTDSFGAYQTHIYELTLDSQTASPAPVGPGAAVPEPAMGGLVLLAAAALTRRPRRRHR